VIEYINNAEECGGEEETLLDKWIYGGQSRRFFREHRSEIQSYNRKMIRLLLIIMPCVTLIYFIFDLNSSGSAMRWSYLACCVGFLLLAALYSFAGKLKPVNDQIWLFFFYELVFVFLLLVGPVLDPTNIACYVPVFFIVSFLMTITPMYFSISIAALDFVVFVAVDFCFKPQNLAFIDMVDALTCAVIGALLGQHILRGRLSEFSAQDQLRASGETELAKALALANIDPLTGVSSRAAYESMEAQMDREIEAETAGSFALVVCDVNWLKETNDELGHEAGDKLLIDCCDIIRGVFSLSTVYRIGGDEFAVLLRDSDYKNREHLMVELRHRIAMAPDLSFASGCSAFEPGTDQDVNDVFIRADSAMYQDKKSIKSVIR